jgi:hypothetical protein
MTDLQSLTIRKKKIDGDIETLLGELKRLQAASSALADQIKKLQPANIDIDDRPVVTYARRCRSGLLKDSESFETICSLVSDSKSSVWTLILKHINLKIEEYTGNAWYDDASIIVVAHRWHLLKLLGEHNADCYLCKDYVTVGPLHRTTELDTTYEHQIHIARLIDIWSNYMVFNVYPKFTIDSEFQDEFKATPVS